MAQWLSCYGSQRKEDIGISHGAGDGLSQGDAETGVGEGFGIEYPTAIVYFGIGVQAIPTATTYYMAFA